MVVAATHWPASAEYSRITERDKYRGYNRMLKWW